MSKSMFAGWKDVFEFTFAQTAKGKFKKKTLITAIVALIIGAAISVIMALVQKDTSVKELPIEKIFVINQSDLNLYDFGAFAVNKDKYPKAQFIETEDEAEALANSDEVGVNDVILELKNTDEGYEANLILPVSTELGKSQGNLFLDDFAAVIETAKIMSSGIEEEKLAAALSEVKVDTIIADEEVKSIGEQVLSDILPMVIMMVLYFVILIDGINMGNAVSVEKTSKLMEMMLTMTRPYALIFGKITALTATAIIQIAVIIVSFVGGFFAGDLVGRSVIFAGYDNYILDVMMAMKSVETSKAFGAGSIILFAIAIVLSILFFFMLAATTGSFGEKTEDVAIYMSYFQLATIGGFIAAILLPLKNIPWASTLLRIVPISSAFILPSDILLGKVTPVAGVLYILLLAIFTIVAVLIAGKVYMNRIFYRGGKNKA